jgi:hypothetical protein
MRLKHYRWGSVPEDEELAEFVLGLSEQHYGGRYLPSMHLYNEKRPSEWRQSLGVLHAHNLPGTAEGWQALMSQLGLGAPVAPRGVAAKRAIRIHRRQVQLDAPLEPRPSLAELASLERSEGLPVMARVRPVRVWCPKRHSYVTVGQQQLWEVR